MDGNKLSVKKATNKKAAGNNSMNGSMVSYGSPYGQMPPVSPHGGAPGNYMGYDPRSSYGGAQQMQQRPQFGHQAQGNAYGAQQQRMGGGQAYGGNYQSPYMQQPQSGQSQYGRPTA